MKGGRLCEGCSTEKEKHYMSKIDDGRLTGVKMWKCETCGHVITEKVKISPYSFNLNDPRDPLRGNIK